MSFIPEMRENCDQPGGVLPEDPFLDDEGAIEEPTLYEEILRKNYVLIPSLPTFGEILEVIHGGYWEVYLALFPLEKGEPGKQQIKAIRLPINDKTFKFILPYLEHALEVRAQVVAHDSHLDRILHPFHVAHLSAEDLSKVRFFGRDFNALEGEEARHTVAELYPGNTLKDLIEMGDSHPLQRLQLAIQTGCSLVDPLQRMTNQGVLHRDLKPRHIIICPNGDIVFGDWDLLTNQAQPYQTKNQGPIFTPAYAHPGLTSRYWPENYDCYALGSSLAEVIFDHPYNWRKKVYNEGELREEAAFLFTRESNFKDERLFSVAQDFFSGVQWLLEENFSHRSNYFEVLQGRFEEARANFQAYLASQAA